VKPKIVARILVGLKQGTNGQNFVLDPPMIASCRVVTVLVTIPGLPKS